ncbi:nickel pincer cofactor biosynthesis protein LarC [Acidobacteria bacterium AH-259-D05]|nr:nickel pincer cofactor biosynthesis protein LarC [Acidobacteria bacterium AH-259-D05]
MSRILYFDPFNGISGDMILGALIHLGLPLDYLKKELAKLKLEEYELVAEEVVRQGLRGVNFQIQQKKASQGHHHGHNSRNFTQIKRLIEESELSSWVKKRSVTIFRRLGEAEARVHETSLEEVHFHEVGALDSIVDIVGACIGFHYFEVEHFFTAPLNLGGGTVTFSHGTWPVPTPATAELLMDFPVYVGKVQGELTTPTGASIVTALVQENTASPVCRYEKWGFGAGDREFREIPNMLRVLLGQRLSCDASEEAVSSPKSEAWQEEEVCVLEANIDDMDAEIFGHFLELALQKGAQEAYCTPLQMKKSRPGIKLSVLCRQEDRERMAELIFRETTTLGVRWSPWKRWILNREIKQMETEYGKVGVKIARFQGQIVNVAPEYEDLKSIAEKFNVPLKAVRQKVMKEIMDQGCE